MEQAPAAPLPRKRVDQPRVEPATIEDLPALTELVMELFAHSGDFSPDRTTQERGLQLILEQPSRGRIFVLRTDHRIIGMVNLLFTASTLAPETVNEIVSAVGSIPLTQDDPLARRVQAAMLLVICCPEYLVQR